MVTMLKKIAKPGFANVGEAGNIIIKIRSTVIQLVSQ